MAEVVSVEVKWEPLEQFFKGDISQMSRYMFMGTTDTGIHLYKNITNRKYLNISDDARIHRYQGGRYVEISREEALRHVEED